MAIISVSLPEKMLSELDEMTKSSGYGNRSDTVRAALKALSSDSRQNNLEGRISAVMLLVHDEDDEAAFSHARHSFEDIIKTLIHNQLGDNKCLEVFILEGEASKVSQLMQACRKSRKADYVKLFVA